MPGSEDGSIPQHGLHISQHQALSCEGGMLVERQH
jgi:hypothetical protein